MDRADSGELRVNFCMKTSIVKSSTQRETFWSFHPVELRLVARERATQGSQSHIPGLVFPFHILLLQLKKWFFILNKNKDSFSCSQVVFQGAERKKERES